MKALSVQLSVFTLICSLFTHTHAEVERPLVIAPYAFNTQATAKELPESTTFDSRIWGPGFGLLYYPTQAFGLELRYSSREDLDAWDDFDGDFDVTSWDALLHFRHDMNTVLFLRAKAGVSFWEAEGYVENTDLFDDVENVGEALAVLSLPWAFSEFDDTTRFEGSGESLVLGLGLGFYLGSRTELTIDLERLEDDMLQLDTLLLGIGIRF